MDTDLNFYATATGLIGGLALFLFGMDVMTGALKQVAGEYLKTILARMTNNRFAGLFSGAAITATIQSSSVTTVLLVGFISAGLMSTSQSIAVILGANIGTTITAQILAFKVSKLALPILATGFFVSFLAKREEWRQYGLIVLGLGMIFFGMAIMSDAMKPLRDYPPFLDLMIRLDNVLLAALVGAAFTAIVQSSSVTTGILIALAGQGLITLEAGIALALGANIGTCITAILAAIGKPREAVRTALVHTLFNVAGVVIWIGFVDQLAELAAAISPAHPNLSGSHRLAAEIPRQIANIHTFFNVANALLFVGFTHQIGRLVEWMLPDRKQTVEEADRPKYLEEQLLDTPSIALDAARREIIELALKVRAMFKGVIPVATSGNRLQLDRLKSLDRPVDHRHRAIVGYLRKVSLGDLSTSHSDLLIGLIKIANNLEHIGDQIARDLVVSTSKRLDENVVISHGTARAIGSLHDKILDALDQVINALRDENIVQAENVRAMKQNLAEMIEEIALHEMARLKTSEPERLKTYTREVELIEILDNVFKTIRRIAQTEIQVFGLKVAAEISVDSEDES